MLGYLLDSGASWVAITDGPRPIRWASRAHGIQPDIPVQMTEVADTLGAATSSTARSPMRSRRDPSLTTTRSDRLAVVNARQLSFAVISTVDRMPSGRSAGSARP